MKFSANLSLLFGEVPFLERFERAARAGFEAVEFWWPAGEDLAAVEAAIRDSGVAVVLFNFDAGDMTAGDRGLLSDPQRQARFAENLPVALDLASRIGCTQLNALLGLELPGHTREEQLALATQNLRWAAQEAAAIGAKVLVEALNTFENGPYLISHTADAAALLDRVGAPNVALQYDVYHMQRMEGNLSDTIRRFAQRIAHVQIADAPGRGEPGTGEINFAYVLGVLAELGYSGHVGLEYIPTTETTEASLRWMPALAP
ncbi:MAG TPA: TIM barrel protein [Solirubrobacteraceae bacterium]|nr:TIM barrel protein [Solirubrobacteraceae bacterium]